MHSAYPSTAVTSPANVVTAIVPGSAATTVTPATPVMPTVRIADGRTSLLELPNEIIFQVAVQLLKSGYSDFFPALSNLVLVSRRTAELMEGTALQILRRYKPGDMDSFWWWTRLQNFVSKQVAAGSDPHLAVSAGLNCLLKPGMHLVPRGGEMLDTILALKHATLPCSTITFDIPGLAALAAVTRPGPRSMASWERLAYAEDARLSEEDALCKRISRFLLNNAQMTERPQALVKWNWGEAGRHDALCALGRAAAKYEKAFLALESSNHPARQSAALIDVLKSGKVISIDLNVRSMKDDVAKELIRAVREADSVQHLRIRYSAYSIYSNRSNWADLLPELNGHASLRKLTVLHWGPAEATRGHLENLPDCPQLETVEFHICVYSHEDIAIADESRKMRGLVDTLRPAGKDKFSVTFVVGQSQSGSMEI